MFGWAKGEYLKLKFAEIERKFGTANKRIDRLNKGRKDEIAKLREKVRMLEIQASTLRQEFGTHSWSRLTDMMREQHVIVLKLADQLGYDIDSEHTAPGMLHRPDVKVTRRKADLEFTTKLTNTLKNAGIRSMEDLLKYSEIELLKLDGVGRKSMQEIKDYLNFLGVSLPSD